MQFHLLRLFKTLKRLKYQQIIGKTKQYFKLNPKIRYNNFHSGVISIDSYSLLQNRELNWNQGEFIFLNYSRSLSQSTSTSFWPKHDAPKLWAYHLHYFDDLSSLKAQSKKEFYNKLIKNWILSCSDIKGDAWESYTVSRRIRNWIKWCLYDIDNRTPEILSSLAKQISFLSYNLETHIQANHLLTNLAALVMGQAFFRGNLRLAFSNTQLSQKFLSQLNEQFLSDGSHYELSPMYQSLILEELLDLFSIIRSTDLFPQIVKKLNQLIPISFQALSIMTRPSGEVSYFNDSTGGIALPFAELVEYSQLLGCSWKDFKYSSSPNLAGGYLKIGNNSFFSALVDTGDIRCKYQPGHTHADSLSFELYYREDEIFVNTGVSTYDVNQRRIFERGSVAHNCLVIDRQNMIDVWSSFRVGQSAKSNLLESDNHNAFITHDGYQKLGISHQRKISIRNNECQIVDNLFLKGKHLLEIFFHLKPNIEVYHLNQLRIQNCIFELELDQKLEWSFEKYFYAETFGKLSESKVLIGRKWVSNNECYILKILKK